MEQFVLTIAYKGEDTMFSAQDGLDKELQCFEFRVELSQILSGVYFFVMTRDVKTHSRSCRCNVTCGIILHLKCFK